MRQGRPSGSIEIEPDDLRLLAAGLREARHRGRAAPGGTTQVPTPLKNHSGCTPILPAPGLPPSMPMRKIFMESDQRRRIAMGHHMHLVAGGGTADVGEAGAGDPEARGLRMIDGGEHAALAQQGQS